MCSGTTTGANHSEPRQQVLELALSAASALMESVFHADDSPNDETLVPSLRVISWVLSHPMRTERVQLHAVTALATLASYVSTLDSVCELWGRFWMASPFAVDCLSKCMLMASLIRCASCGDASCARRRERR